MIGIVDPSDVSFDGVGLVRFVFGVSVFVAPKKIEHCHNFVIGIIEKFFLETFDPSEKLEGFFWSENSNKQNFKNSLKMPD